MSDDQNPSIESTTDKVEAAVSDASETKVDEAVAADGGSVDSSQNAAQTSGEASSGRKPRNRRRRVAVISVIAVVVIAAGIGFYVWHETPGFCNAICHAPQDPINATYDGEIGQAGYDKWGNAVEDMGDLMVVVHKEEGIVCMDCHKPTIGQQITEGMHWVSGSYDYPLDERSLTDLNFYQQVDDPESFCLNESCHNLTRDDLIAATANLGEYNPHETKALHEQLQCSDCHKSHRQSVNACSRCHEDEAPIPDGWLSASEAATLDASDFNY